MAASPNETLKVVTLNCWGIPFISKHVQERFAAIGDRLNEGNYDVVALQEVWSQDNYKALIDKCNQSLPYSHYFHSGHIGAGICVFSKHPITHALTLPYTLNGRPYMISHGDWFAGKALGMCKIHLEDLEKQFVVMVTHTHAEYSYKHLKKEYVVHRTAQACELGMAANLFTECKAADGALILGDFNFRPKSLGYRVLQTLSAMRDSWVEVHGDENDVIGTTSDRPDNRYSARHKDYEFPNGQRIDMIWFSGNLKPKECRIRPWGAEISEGSGIPFSDHEPVQAIFELTKDAAEKASVEKEEIEKLGEEVTEIMQNGINHLNKYQLFAVMLLGLLCVLLYVVVCFTDLPVLLNLVLIVAVLLSLLFCVLQLMQTIPTEINKCLGVIANVATWPSDPQILHNHKVQ